mgnify:CR=1 FL=1
MQLVIGDDDTLHHPDRHHAGHALATLIGASRRSLWLRRALNFRSAGVTLGAPQPAEPPSEPHSSRRRPAPSTSF